MNKPIVSIIIPCSRPILVEKTIKSILKQNYSLDRIEIILVGKYSHILNQKYVKKVIRGEFYPSKGRNLGAKAANGDFLLFVDDDCEVHKHWVEENLSALKDRKIGAVSGMIVGKSPRFFARCTDFTNFDLCQTEKKCERVLCSATIGVRREVFWQIGGFNGNLRVGEDIDFCYKLIERGYKTIYEPKIKVVHDHRRDTLWRLLGYMYFGGRKSGLFFQKKYPGLVQNAKIFSKIQHPFLFALCILPLSLLMVLKSLKINFREHKKILIYAPFIFLAKLSYNIGVFFWLIKEKVR